jgi:ABC-2 type transport system permease protein
MTTRTTALRTPLAASDALRPARFVHTLAAEWAKLAFLRSTYLILGLGVVLSIGTAALVCLALGSTQGNWSADFSPITTSMVGNIWALIVAAVFGVLVMSREYSSGGLIRLTLTVTPKRGRVLAAKVMLVLGITVVFGVLTTVGMSLAGQAVLGAYGRPTTDLGNADAQRMVLGLGVTMAFFPIIGLALTVLFRSTAGAITAVLGLLWLPQIVGEFMPRWWQEHAISRLPGSAVDSLTISHIESSLSYSDPPVAAVVAGMWLVAIVGAAYITLLRRDAWWTTSLAQRKRNDRKT